MDFLEEKFRRVERASERRALDEPELSRNELVDLSMEPRKHRKKPAISVSQFGKQEEREDDGLHSPVPSPLSAAASKSTFYHTLANPRSVESCVSDNSEEETQHTDEQHEIQVERIAGHQTLPKTVGVLLPRRLAHAQSQLDFASINRGMVIDVSVETTTESSHFPPNLQRSTAYAARPRAATVGVLTSHGGLVELAKDFARKLRRKSRAE